MRAAILALLVACSDSDERDPDERVVCEGWGATYVSCSPECSAFRIPDANKDCSIALGQTCFGSNGVQGDDFDGNAGCCIAQPTIAGSMGNDLVWVSCQ